MLACLIAEEVNHQGIESHGQHHGNKDKSSRKKVDEGIDPY